MCMRSGEGPALGVHENMAATTAVLPSVRPARHNHISGLGRLADEGSQVLFLSTTHDVTECCCQPAAWNEVWHPSLLMMCYFVCSIRHPKVVMQRGGTGGNNKFVTESITWQPRSSIESYLMPPCPVRPPDARFDPAAPPFTPAWWTVRLSIRLLFC